MRKLFAKLHREEGVTLIELIAVLSIMSIILGIISTTIFFGFRSYNRISVENNLRDQGDVLMSSIITELYTSAPDRVYPLTDDSGNTYGIQLVEENADGTPNMDTAEEIVIQDGQLEIHRSKTDTTASYEATRIRGGGKLVVSSANADSYIGLEGKNLNVFGYLETGLIKIKLVLWMDNGSDASEITLESRFGF
ncbi:type II secretion system protein [Saccharibacillus qingshengii]|uniref:type II secretion system protein n=1 Tax=Saccharibacillus qingshengii TaxID=1763540 RepID=UPI00155265DE|nr:type II secretion system protein [Saccharibacillus qingshengii]